MEKSEDAIAPPVSRVDRNPRIGAASFICPHCKALAQQSWFEAHADSAETPPPEYDSGALREMIETERASQARGKDASFSVERMSGFVAAVEAGLPFLDHVSGGFYVRWTLGNVHLSRCFACDKPALWVGGRIVHPATNAEVPEPNEDLPADIRRDYVEAGEIVMASPRAAAALLRLAIQKLCSHLLQRDGAINEMIGDLVAQRSLSPLTQRALDVVRVIGNEAVHPGELDLRDDRSTATQLFGLVNLIAEQMISAPKHVMALYRTLPPDKVAGIEQRDAKARRANGYDGKPEA